MRAARAVRRLVATAPAVFARAPLARTRCILATRCGLAALEELGVEAVALSVRTRAANAAMVAWAEEGWPGGPEEGLARGAFVLETDARPLGVPVDPATRGWRGHLVVFVPSLGLAVDLDAQQMARPERGLDVPPALALELGSPPGRRVFALPRGALLEVVPVPGDRTYAVAPDWRHEPDRRLVRALVRGVRRAGAAS